MCKVIVIENLFMQHGYIKPNRKKCDRQPNRLWANAPLRGVIFLISAILRFEKQTFSK